MTVMGRTGIKKLSIKKEDFELQLEQQSDEKVHFLSENGVPQDWQEQSFRRASLPTQLKMDLPASLSAPVASSDKENAQAVAGEYITSPMVGTFYLSASPDEAPFVKVGDKIDKNSVVCIIEAMKVMNEIKSGISGTVAEVLVENGHPVEFGTKIFRLI